MDKAAVLTWIRELGVIPILRTPTAADALAISAILHGANVPCVEIPLTVPGALDVIRDLVHRYGKTMLVGAGTVLDANGADACIAAGAQFIISPAVNVDTIAHCRRAGVAVIPGALTPTEIVTAWKAGADMIKVFPANSMGGPPYIRSLRGPLPSIEFITTGGVTEENAGAYINAGACAVGVGGDLIDLQAVRDGRSAVIAARARRYVDAVARARLTPPTV